MIVLNNKPRVVGSSSTSEYKDVRIDEILPTNSCGLCEITCAPQMKECLKFLNKNVTPKKLSMKATTRRRRIRKPSIYGFLVVYWQCYRFCTETKYMLMGR